MRDLALKIRTTISTNGQLVIPDEVRIRDDIRPGDQFEIVKIRPGEYSLRRVAEVPNCNLIDWLLACPVKGFFQPIQSESTEALHNTRRRRTK